MAGLMKCIVTGYKNKLKLVISHKLEDGITGKCIIDNTISSDPELCTEGGNPKKAAIVKNSLQLVILILIHRLLEGKLLGKLDYVLIFLK